MYPVSAPQVLVHERVLEKPAARARMQRMVGAMKAAEVVVVDDAELDRIAGERQWPMVHRRRTGQWKRYSDPVVIFSCFTWEPPERIAERRRRFPNLAAALLDGSRPWTFRDGRSYYGRRGTVCQDAWEIHSAWGCLHRCDYCHVGPFLNIMCNLEELAERLPLLMRRNPWLLLYKYDNMTDTIAMEPEYGASQVMVGLFARTPGRYLMLYTKSDNVEHLLDLEHRGRTIVSFTISSPTVARFIEKCAPSTWARIRAAAMVQEAGYRVRVRFSPIVPVWGWREENREMIAALLEAVRPDIITMDLLGWMNPAAIEEVLDVSLIESRFIDGMRQLYKDGPPGPAYWPTSKHIFPHELRKEVYDFFIDEIRRHDRDVMIALCNETREMWAELGPRLEQSPERYVCGCGPDSVPGNPLLRR